MQSMFSYRKAAVERAMKVQEVILRAMAKKITWWQAGGWVAHPSARSISKTTEGGPPARQSHTSTYSTLFVKRSGP